MRLKHPDMQGDIINLEALDIKLSELIPMSTRELNKFFKVRQHFINKILHTSLNKIFLSPKV